MKRRYRRTRLDLIPLLWALPLALIIPRLLWLQVAQVDQLDRRAERQRMQRVTVPAQRGDIVDRHGRPMAYSLADTSSSTAYSMARRVYPYGARAAQLVGFLNSNGKGAAGLEKRFEKTLRGHPGWATRLRDGDPTDKKPNFILPNSRSRKPERGHTVVLTIDAAVQDIAAGAIDDAVKNLEAKRGVVVAVDPRTGDVLAIAGSPTFDPERPANFPYSRYGLRAVSDPVEPGSTAKLIPALAALRSGTITPETIIHCEDGRYRMGRRLITDHDPYGALTFRRCFAVSSNIAFAKVGELLDPNALYATARDLGFGRASGIHLPGESRGRVYPVKRWTRESAPSISIGYEILVTPLQLAMAYSAIANDGVLMRPRILKALLGSEEDSHVEFRPESAQRVCEPSEARLLKEFMSEVVEDGTGGAASLPWARVGGKTGTAEKLINGAYSRKNHLTTFVGMAPVEDPRIVVLVMIDDPQKEIWGGTAAAPVFKRVLEAYARVDKALIHPDYPEVVVAPEGERSLVSLIEPAVAGGAASVSGTLSNSGGLPDVRGMSTRRALQVLGGEAVHVVGSGVVCSQKPAPGTRAEGSVTLTCRDACS